MWRFKKFISGIITVGFFCNSFLAYSYTPPLIHKYSTKKLSRKDKGKMYWGIFYMPGLNVNFLRWASLENFIKYHNIYYSNILSEPLPLDYSFKPAFIHGFEANIMAFTLNTLWTKTVADMQATYTNGNQRIISIDYNTFQMGLDVEIPIRMIRFGLCNGLTMHWGEFSSGYKYTNLGNGYISYAQDQPMNGIYSTPRIFEYMLGGRLGVTWKFLKFVFKAQHVFQGDDETHYLIPSYDKLFSTVPGFGYYSDGDIPEYFYYAPQDMSNLNYHTELINYPHGWFITFQLGIGFTNIFDIKLKNYF